MHELAALLNAEVSGQLQTSEVSACIEEDAGWRAEWNLDTLWRHTIWPRSDTDCNVNAGNMSIVQRDCRNVTCNYFRLYIDWFEYNSLFCHVFEKEPPWLESASELYRPSDRRLSLKLVPTFADRGCHVVSVTDPYGRILGFLDRNRYFSLSSSSFVLTRLSGLRSRPTTSQIIW
jgi:hypothetical protein